MAPWEGKTLLVNVPTIDKSSIIFMEKPERKSTEVHPTTEHVLHFPWISALFNTGNILIHIPLSTIKLRDLIFMITSKDTNFQALGISFPWPNLQTLRILLTLKFTKASTQQIRNTQLAIYYDGFSSSNARSLTKETNEIKKNPVLPVSI